MNIDKTLNQLCAVLLAKSLTDLYPQSLLGESQILDEGFSYAFLTDCNVSSNDLPKIVKQMQKNIDRAFAIKYQIISKKQALSLFAHNRFKITLIQQHANDEISIIRLGDEFVDLCPHLDIQKLSDIKSYDLLNVSGVYWQGSAKNEQLTAINGIGFTNKNDLIQYKNLLIERKERDHRIIGAQLDLFYFNTLAGQGLPIWLPNGTVIKHEIENFIHDLLAFNGYQFVQTPVLGSKQLYVTSGHWSHYRENMFPPIDVDGEILELRPMTCPHHLLVYQRQTHSYRELPIRFAEHAILHRYEASGALTGLERVRSMQLVDTHIICTHEMIKQEVKHSYEMIKQAHATLGTTIHAVDLSLHDPKDKAKFFDNEPMWQNAENQLRDALKTLKIKYREVVGEAAFYGPKIDLQIKTVLGHVITVSTIQLDFLLPERFQLTYKDHNGTIARPILIHAGIIGTFERYMSILIEQNKGVFPLWLTPVQAIIIPVEHSKHMSYCQAIFAKLNQHKIRVQIDATDERLSKRIRDAQIHKIPYQLVIGDNEIKHKNITYRQYGQQTSHTLTLTNFVKLINKQIKSKA